MSGNDIRADLASVQNLMKKILCPHVGIPTDGQHSRTVYVYIPRCEGASFYFCFYLISHNPIITAEVFPLPIQRGSLISHAMKTIPHVE